MTPILTYQDLKELDGNEPERMKFLLRAINEHKRSARYKTAVDAEAYYDGENPTITRYEKIIYDMQGRAQKDMYTANHKITSRFFKIAVQQSVSYLLGNGVTFQDAGTKEKLGTRTKPFDRAVQAAGKYAQIGGVSFGFWNMDHVDVFQITEFVPLVDEENGALTAGIRFWQLDRDKPLRVTLYETDGFTEYIQRPGEKITVLAPKRAYKLHLQKSELLPTQIYNAENYPSFPIVPLRNNRKEKSELVGNRNTIDALDLARSNMVNNVDEGNLIYWVLVGCDGMDEEDDQAFLDQLRRTKVAHAGKGGSDGVSVEAHSVEAPYVGTETAIEMLERTLYQDFQAFNSNDVTASNQSATAIDAAYTNLDLKTDEFEGQVTDFVKGILALAGIEDEPAYTRSKLVNPQEAMQTVLMAAEYLDDEYITRKALTLMGDGDLADAVLERRAAEDLDRLSGGDESGGEDDPETDNPDSGET